MARLGVAVAACCRLVSNPALMGLDPNEEALLHHTIQSEEIDQKNTANPYLVDQARHCVIVVGITGAGKSSTANTLRNSRSDVFDVADSITSVTRSTAFKDYIVGGPRKIAATAAGSLERQQAMLAAQTGTQKAGVPFRVIDTPGLMDTNRAQEDLSTEFEQLQRLAPHGVSAFVVCVPMGRVTSEHERSLQALTQMFGEEVVKHSVVVVTHAMSDRNTLMRRDEIVNGVNQLPPGHFLREWVEGAGWRVVGVENRLEPHRTKSGMMLHQAVLSCVEQNGGRYQFKERPEASHASPAHPQLPGGGVCKHSVEHIDGRLRVTIVYEIRAELPQPC